MSKDQEPVGTDIIDHLEWTSQGIVEWLRGGFRAIEQAQRPSIIRLAFRPIELHTESEPIGQVAAALLEGAFAGIPGARQVEQVVRQYLTSEDAISGGDWQFLRQLWRLLGGLRAGPDVASTARKFLDQIADVSLDVLEGMVTVVSATVANSRPVTNQQVSFFEHLNSTYPELWDDSLTIVAIDTGFAKAAEDREQFIPGAADPDEVWSVLKRRWASGIIVILRAGGRATTALVQMISLRRGMPLGELSESRLLSEIESELTTLDMSRVSFEEMIEIPALEDAYD